MRVLAGMCLIAAALLNLWAATGFIGGILADAVVEGFQLENLKVAAGMPIYPDASPLIRALQARGLDLDQIMFALGIVYAMSSPVLIMGAVYLFLKRGALFIVLASLVALTVEVCDFGLATFGPVNAFGLVGGVLGMAAAIGITLNRLAARRQVRTTHGEPAPAEHPAP